MNLNENSVWKAVTDPMVLMLTGAGLVLMAATLYLRINPVEGSVVADPVRGTVVHYILLATTMPAWIIGMLIGNSTWVSFVLMFIVQAVLYAGVGLFLRWLCKKLFGDHP